MITYDEVSLISKHLSFWDHISETQRDYLINSAGSFHYEKGSTLHHSDSDCLGMIFLKSGVLRVYMLSDEGREVTLFRLYPNDVCVLSASCVLSAITFDIHIDADETCDIIQIKPNVFAKISEENVYAELFSYKTTTERFSDVMWAMQQILFSSFDKRLATFLLDESSKNNSSTIKLTHEQIARYMGSAREVVSRMLKYFVTEGYVSLSRGEIHILDKKGLFHLIK